MEVISEYEYLYKYLPFTDGSLKIISEGTIKFTHPADFNDPFDCRPYIDAETIKELPRARPDLFKRLNKKLGLSPAKSLQQRGKQLARLRQSVESGAFWQDITDIGVVCLSQNPLNILMWSHYAENHQGFVVEFRIPRLSDDPEKIADIKTKLSSYLIPHEVRYRSQRPKHSFGSGTSIDLLLTKSEDWRYESEHRVIDFERGSGIFPFERDEILASVIAGMKMSDTNFAKLNEIVDHTAKQCQQEVRLFKAEEVEDRYQLVVPGHPRLSSGV